jgi:hypothetical protein
MRVIRCAPAGGLRLTLGILLLHHVVATGVAAQSVFRVTPSISVTQMYDSNILFTPSDRQADFITRVTPAIESEYRSPLWTLSGRYTLDGERFAQHATLSRANAQQHAVAGIRYQPTARMVVAVATEFARTQTPGELVPQTGLAFGRRAAQRLGAHSSIAHRLSPVTTGTIGYKFTEDRIEGGILIRSHDATIAAERRMSERDTLDAAFRSRQFLFGAASATSQVLRLGWTRAVTGRVSVSIDAGPNVTNARPGLDLAVSLRNRFDAGDVSVAYMREPTTVFGLAGTVDTQSVSATTSWDARRWLRIRVTPAFYQSELAAVRADVYRLMVDTVWSIAGNLSLETSFNASQQRGGLYAGFAGQIVPRHEAVIRLVAAPRPPLR